MKKILFFIGLLACTFMSAQSITVTGVITDGNSIPVPGANVFEKSTNNGVVTDFDGNYTITISSSEAVLAFSFMGYVSQEVNVEGRTKINVTLVEDVGLLDEVVVTALGVLSKKKSLGYSVTKISGESISQNQETNIASSLSGKVAGVVSTGSASGMGGSTRVVLRGNSSLTGNNQPLYVVDGVPVNNTGLGTSATGAKSITNEQTDYGTGISDINPNDIEAISVLKGANAAALYGSSAANGVILITTKKGSYGKGLGVSFSSSLMVGVVNDETLPSFQNEYGQGVNGSFQADADVNWGPKFDSRSYQTIKGVDKTYNAQPNNVRDFFNTEIERTNSVSIQGGGEKANILFSYSNFKGDGIVPNSQLNKNNFNIRANVKLSDKLNFDSKITYFTQKATARVIPGSGRSSITKNVYGMVRSAEIEDFKDYGDENTGSLHPYSTTVALGNPYWTQYKNINGDTKKRVISLAKATYQFNDDLSMHARIGSDFTNQNIQRISVYGFSGVPLGNRSDRAYEYVSTNADVLFMFNKELTTGLNLNLNAGGNYAFSTTSNLITGGEDFKIPTNIQYSNLTNKIKIIESESKFALYSAYISGGIDYKEMVYLNFSGRNDWNSGLWTPTGSPSDWSYFYPSASLSFVGNDLLGISEDSFLSFSKLRVSWAEVGAGGSKTDKIYYYLANSSQSYNGLSTVTKSDVYDDPNLKPESTVSKEIGLELKFFKNRLYTDVTYYQSNTFDQILNAPVDPSSGFKYKRTNVGEISNKGIEVLIGGTPIKSNDFYWDTSVNFSKNTNVLESFIEGTESYLFNSYEAFSVKTKVGGEIGDLYGRDFTYHEGKMVVNANGLPIASEEKLLGNYQPDVTGGFNNTFGYKNLELSFLISFRIGGEAYSQSDRELSRSGSLQNTLENRGGVVLDAVVNKGTADAPNYEPNTVEVNSEQYWAAMYNIESPHIRDLSNVRLRELSLKYSLPSKILEKTLIRNASISLIGRNLFFLSKNADGVDPESSVSVGNNGQGSFYYNLPTTRTIGLNLNVSF